MKNDFPIFMAVIDVAWFRPDIIKPESHVPTGIGAVAYLDRLQAHLGALRLWKSGQWVGITGLAVSFFSWRLATLTEGQSLLLAILSIGVGIATNVIYRIKDPKPY